MTQQTEYQTLLTASGLRQADLAALLGKDRTAVNRWDNTSSAQGLPAPRYAIAFLRAYVMLSPDQRAALAAQG
jgi:transcriptional regulator with XRE-family HTH domain